jgi:hypothetical protein
MRRLQRIEEDLRTWGQGAAPALTHRQLAELQTICDRIHIERMPREEATVESIMGG